MQTLNIKLAELKHDDRPLITESLSVVTFGSFPNNL